MTVGPTTGLAGAGAGRAAVWRAAVPAAWLLAFAVTRLVPLLLTLDPSLYGTGVSDPTGDLGRYAGWAELVVAEGLAPYRDVDIEYPPGSLPFVLLPALLAQAQFSRAIFVGLMIGVDLAAFVALLVLGRRTGSRWGAVTWLVLPPLLGVVLYARLDLVPAAAVLLGLERAHARRWAVSGVWFGLGTAAKLFPGLLLPLALIAAAGRRVRLVAGAAIGGAVAWLPFAGDTGDLITDVFGYHSARGIHLESIWGAVLNLRRIEGGPVELVFDYGAFHIVGPGSDLMLRATTALSVALVALFVAAAWARWWRRPELAPTELPLAATALISLLLGTGRVFSPQFVVWLLAAAAVAFAVQPRAAVWAWPLLALIVVLTAVGYPLGFDLLRDGHLWPAVILLVRNLAVIVLGGALLVRWLRSPLMPATAGAPAARR